VGTELALDLDSALVNEHLSFLLLLSPVINRQIDGRFVRVRRSLATLGWRLRLLQRRLLLLEKLRLSRKARKLQLFCGGRRGLTNHFWRGIHFLRRLLLRLSALVVQGGALGCVLGATLLARRARTLLLLLQTARVRALLALSAGPSSLQRFVCLNRVDRALVALLRDVLTVVFTFLLQSVQIITHRF